jgi:hypothetical protein
MFNLQNNKYNYKNRGNFETHLLNIQKNNRDNAIKYQEQKIIEQQKIILEQQNKILELEKKINQQQYISQNKINNQDDKLEEKIEEKNLGKNLEKKTYNYCNGLKLGDYLKSLK